MARHWFAGFDPRSGAFGLKKMPGCVKTGLLPLVAFTWLAGVQYLVTPGLVRGLMTMVEHLTLSSSIGVQLALGLANTPHGVLFGVPIVSILTELRTGRRTNGFGPDGLDPQPR